METDILGYSDKGVSSVFPIVVKGDLWFIVNHSTYGDIVYFEPHIDPFYYPYNNTTGVQKISFTNDNHRHNYQFPVENRGDSSIVPFAYQVGSNVYFGSYELYLYDLTYKTVQVKSRIQVTSLSSISAKARLLPPQAVMNVINSSIRKIDAKVLIQWNGTDWIDESENLVSFNINFDLGSGLSETIAGEMDVELENTDDRFTPGSLSTIKDYLKPRVKIKVWLAFGGIDYWLPMFTGYIKAYQPDSLSGICNLHCFDNTQYILNIPSGRLIWTDIRTDEAVKELLDIAGVTGYGLETGTQYITAISTDNQYVNPLITNIAIAERGRAFFDEDGVFRFWNKDHLHNLPTLSFITLNREYFIKKIDYGVAEQSIKNSVTVTAKPMAPCGVQVIWSNGSDMGLDPYTSTLLYIPANGYQNAWVEVDDPCITWIQPVPLIDYIANTLQDGTGTDKTSSIEIGGFNTYDKSCFIQVFNRSNVDIYFTQFNVRADPLRVWKYIKYQFQDDASIALYGQQSLDITNDLIGSEDQAEQIAIEELNRWKDAKNNFTADIIGLPYLRCGDVIEVEMPDGTFANQMVSSLTTTFDDSGLKQQIKFIEPFIISPIATIEAGAYII